MYVNRNNTDQKEAKKERASQNMQQQQQICRGNFCLCLIFQCVQILCRNNVIVLLTPVMGCYLHILPFNTITLTQTQRIYTYTNRQQNS